MTDDDVVSSDTRAPTREIESVSKAETESTVQPQPEVLDQLGGSTGEANAGISAPQLLVRGKEPFKRRRVLGALESLIGVDERVRIMDTHAAPWRMICQLEIIGETGSGVGTGWFAGPRTIITAGHCVHDVQIGGWAKKIIVHPGRNRDIEPFVVLESTRLSTTRQWFQDRDPDYDYGAIHLGPAADAVTQRTGWFSTAALNEAALFQQRVNVSGYPGDKGDPPLQPLWASEQWFHAKQILRVTSRRLFYDVDTMGGQSGAPVWIDEGNGPVVVGIHAYGVGGAAHLGLEANSAPRIDTAVLSRIRKWVQADQGP
jgi:glutamyl endopeptidase